MVVTVSEFEVLHNSNDSELGELVRKRYWELKKVLEQPHYCSICGGPTHDVDGEYLQEWDHLSCVLDLQLKKPKDKCVLCGKESPYTIDTHIDYRVGYVEGVGQGCFQPNKCEKK